VVGGITQKTLSMCVGSYGNQNLFPFSFFSSSCLCSSDFYLDKRKAKHILVCIRISFPNNQAIMCLGFSINSSLPSKGAFFTLTLINLFITNELVHICLRMEFVFIPFLTKGGYKSDVVQAQVLSDLRKGYTTDQGIILKISVFLFFFLIKGNLETWISQKFAKYNNIMIPYINYNKRHNN
jgi:hypothetical protein